MGKCYGKESRKTKELETIYAPKYKPVSNTDKSEQKEAGEDEDVQIQESTVKTLDKLTVNDEEKESKDHSQAIADVHVEENSSEEAKSSPCKEGKEDIVPEPNNDVSLQKEDEQQDKTDVCGVSSGDKDDKKDFDAQHEESSKSVETKTMERHGEGAYISDNIAYVDKPWNFARGTPCEVHPSGEDFNDIKSKKSTQSESKPSLQGQRTNGQGSNNLTGQIDSGKHTSLSKEETNNQLMTQDREKTEKKDTKIQPKAQDNDKKDTQTGSGEHNILPKEETNNQPMVQDREKTEKKDTKIQQKAQDNDKKDTQTGSGEHKPLPREETYNQPMVKDREKIEKKKTEIQPKTKDREKKDTQTDSGEHKPLHVPREDTHNQSMADDREKREQKNKTTNIQPTETNERPQIGAENSEFSEPINSQNNEPSNQPQTQKKTKKKKKKKKKKDEYSGGNTITVGKGGTVVFGVQNVKNIYNQETPKKKKSEENLTSGDTKPFSHYDAVATIGKSVGYIFGPKKEGTCWRVGKDKIITAFHVVAGNIWNPTSDGGGTLYEPWIAKMKVDFNYVDKKSHKCFELHERLYYHDETLDVAVLQLKTNTSLTLPPPIEMFDEVTPEKHSDQEIILISHSRGKSREVNSGIGLYNPTEQKMKELQEFCKDFGEGNGYVGLDNKSRLVIKCKFEGGASGCPGFTILNDGKPRVVLIYLQGYPTFYYSQIFSKEKKNHFPQDKLLQQGVGIYSLYRAMTQKKFYLGLRNEIFPLEAEREHQSKSYAQQNQYAMAGDNLPKSHSDQNEQENLNITNKDQSQHSNNIVDQELKNKDPTQNLSGETSTTKEKTEGLRQVQSQNAISQMAAVSEASIYQRQASLCLPSGRGYLDSPTDEHQDIRGSKTSVRSTEFTVSLAFDIPWRPEFDNPFSPVYQEFLQNITSALAAAFGDVPGLLSITPVKLSRGSVVAEFSAVFDSPMYTAEDIKMAIMEAVNGPLQGSPLFQNVITDRIGVTAESSGTIMPGEDLVISLKRSPGRIRPVSTVTLEEWIGASTEAFTEKALEDIDLMDLSKAINPLQFNMIGLELQLKQYDLDKIKADNRSDHSYQMLYKWRNKLGKSATLKKCVDNMFSCWEKDNGCIYTDNVKSAIDSIRKRNK